MNPNLYRLHEIHKIERELNEEKLKHPAMIKSIIACWTFALAAFWFFSFVCFFWTLGFCQVSKKSSELFLGSFYMDWTCFL